MDLAFIEAVQKFLNSFISESFVKLSVESDINY